MEKRLNKKLGDWVTKFKSDVCQKINIEKENMNFNDLVTYIYDYERLVIEKDDLAKRKRLKNTTPLVNRCCAKRANGEQCTRNKKGDSDFCGTHAKNAPHGLMNNETNVKKNIQIYTEDIKGIIYYIDNNENVYKMEDIMKNVDEPSIIGKYQKNFNGNIDIMFF